MTTTALKGTAVPQQKWDRHRVRIFFNKHVLTILAIAIFLFLYVPILILIIYSFNENRFVSTWTGFSVQWYRVLFEDEQMASALRLSLWVAIWSTIVSTILGTLAALAMERFRFKGRLAFDGMLYLPIIIPDIAMALSTLLFFVVLGIALSRYTILIAHVAFNIAFVAIIVRARLADMDDSLEEAAADLGADQWITFRRITLPLLAPGIVAAALLAFTLSLDDFVITFFVAGPGSTTLPVRVYSMIRFGLSPEVNAVSTLMFVASTALVVISLLAQRR
ncbi:MAG: ABC transporter permease [Anaerolineales bacterium]|nr:ABC transporter permease [Anaerolineales bacterium]